MKSGDVRIDVNMDTNLDGKGTKTLGPLYFQKTHTVIHSDERKHKHTFTYDLTEGNIFPVKWDKKDADLHLKGDRTLVRRLKKDGCQNR